MDRQRKNDLSSSQESINERRSHVNQPLAHQPHAWPLLLSTTVGNLFYLALCGETALLSRESSIHNTSVMKKRALILSVFSLALVASVIWFSCGCGKSTPGAPSGASTPAGAGTSPVSAERTSFTEVTAQLDPGGNFYLYLSTAQWLETLSTKVDSWRGTVAAFPGLTPENTDNVNKGFDLVNHLIKDSGIEDVTGVGMSSVEIEKGLFRNKMLIHHYAGKGDGFLWKMYGQKPHPLTGLDLLPASTALALFADVDVRLLWTVAQQEATNSGFPQAKEFIAQVPTQFEQATKLKWDAVLNSFGGEAGFVLTLNESNTIPIPLPGNALSIPEPGLLLVLKVNDDTLFNRIDQELKSNALTVVADHDGVRMRTLPIPVPFLGTLRPSAASSGGYLLIASSDTLVTDCLAVKNGKAPGLKGTAEFKRLAQGIPDQGNQFCFMSERCGRLLSQVQQQSLASGMANGGSSAAQAQWMQALFQNRQAFAYSVGVSTAEGCLCVGNGSQSYANLVLLPAVAVPAMLSAIAIPNFVKARTTAQENACINNLRQLAAAKNEWALEKKKQPTDVPTQEDLLPYLHAWPTCPAGGTYIIGPVGETPKCSVPGHVLP